MSDKRQMDCYYAQGGLLGEARRAEAQSSLAAMPGSASGVEAEVCADIAARQAKGIAKYGTTVEANPLSLEQWLQHAYEECLDQAVYLKKCIAVTKTPNAGTQRPGSPDGSLATETRKPGSLK